MHDQNAHLGLVDPLADAPVRCNGCHADKPRIADSYLSVARTPRVPPAAETPSKTADSSRREPDTMVASPRGTQPGNVVFAALILLCALGGGSYVFANERARRANRKRLTELFWRSAWSPYSAGALLGLVAGSLASLRARLSLV